MSGPIESDIIRKIKIKYGRIYNIESSYKRQETGLPRNSKEKIYFPDIILRDKITGKIKHIIEVETDPVRKSIVGASILADYCVGLDQPKDKPQLSFIVGNEKTESGKSGLKQLPRFQKRGVAIDSYLKHINVPVNINTENEILKKIE